MSLARLALRLAAIEALCPSATVATGPYPTVAGARVDDSRVDLIAAAESPEAIAAALAALENNPLLVVYTEEQQTSPYGDVRYPAAEEVVTLVIEAMIAGSGVMQIELPDGTIQSIGTLEAPVTDRQHEAMLDLLEAQVRYILTIKNRAPTAVLYNKVAMETRMIHSDPQRAADRTLRLASRTIKFHVKVKAEVWPAPVAALPEPLASVAAGLAPGSSGALLCASLLPLIPGAPALPPPLQGIDIYTHLDGTASATDPDGVHAVAAAMDFSSGGNSGLIAALAG
ncbi:hypothetical protein [Methylocella tundrae]|uniref:Uncharacterized protein n=1 Tax=Methylocella tundrae TaxID=227605 RepID=A0A4U8YVT1_METTU|nr:hypothetical protein [Methylocella tundrae]WPP05505.1 hypothetical protein SIN04_06685 [Methylocella tundrae]VFU07930.1 conserved protein of unknown function [Methylocella tundrae]